MFNRPLQQTAVNLQKLHFIPIIYSIVKYIFSKAYLLFIHSFLVFFFGLLAQLSISEICPRNTLKEIPLA